MKAAADAPIIRPADLTTFLISFGLAPLLLAREFQRDLSPASFALTPMWSIDQLAFVGVAGAGFGLMSSRPAQASAGIALGIMLGLGADLWWLGGWVTPDDQSFVSMLSQAEWRSRLTMSALQLLGVAGLGFLVGTVLRLRLRGRPGRRPARSELAAIAVAVIGGPILALAIASIGASSALLVPDGTQVQRLKVGAGAMTVEPVILHPGPTRFQCHFAADALPASAYLLAIPEAAAVEPTSPSFDDVASSCGPEPGRVTWGPVGDLPPGRYVWKQIDDQIDFSTDPRTIAMSPVVVVAP
jgi:hypothetical protein